MCSSLVINIAFLLYYGKIAITRKYLAACLYYLTILGDFMDLITLGVNFPHKKGEFCQKAKFPQYTVCVFSTPFLYLHDGKLVKGEAGDILINTPDYFVYHGPRADSDEGFVNDWMRIEGDDITELLNKYPLPLNRAFHIGEGMLLRKYFNSLYSEFKSGMAGSSDMIESIITQMIIATHRAYKKQNTCDEDFHEIAAIRHAIIKNPGNTWTLKRMAAMSGYSISRFSELYRKLYNISPINDVIQHRISLAKMLLSSRQVSVSYVATVCGFNTINYFSKVFKASTGYTPSDYVKHF